MDSDAPETPKSVERKPLPLPLLILAVILVVGAGVIAYRMSQQAKAHSASAQADILKDKVLNAQSVQITSLPTTPTP